MSNRKPSASYLRRARKMNKLKPPDYLTKTRTLVEATKEEDGTSGQDRNSYSDDQDRDSYNAR